MTQWEGKHLPMVSETMSLIPSTTKEKRRGCQNKLGMMVHN